MSSTSSSADSYLGDGSDRVSMENFDLLKVLGKGGEYVICIKVYFLN